MKEICTKKDRRGLTGCVTCNWEKCQVLNEQEKTNVYHLEEMKDEHREE